LRKDPRKLPILYYNLSPGKSAEQNEFPFVNARLDDKYSEETSEKILLDSSIALYNRMVVELTNRSIVNLTSRLALQSTVSAHHESEGNEERYTISSQDRS